MKQMSQCGRCGSVNPPNQSICSNCGENLILNGRMVNVDDDGRVYPLGMVDSQPFDVTYDPTEQPQPQKQPEPQPQPQKQPEPQPQPQRQPEPQPQNWQQPQQNPPYQQTPPPQKKPKKKHHFVKWIVILCLLAALGGGGYFVWNEYLKDSSLFSGKGNLKTMTCSISETDGDMDIEMDYNEDDEIVHMHVLLELDLDDSRLASEIEEEYEKDPGSVLSEIGLPDYVADYTKVKASGSRLTFDIEGDVDELELDELADVSIDEAMEQIEDMGFSCDKDE